ncbi:MAG TPA: hypothetical protein DEW74_01745 [Opitutae bacterium]|nr:hypothetical protein [Opitutae bacterium]
MALENNLNPINNTDVNQQNISATDVNKTEANQEKQEVQNTEKGLWASIKSGFKKIAKGVGALATLLGASAVGMAIYSIATTIAAVGFAAALTPVLPLLIAGAALVVGGILVYKFLGDGNATQLLTQATVTAIASGMSGQGPNSIKELGEKMIDGSKKIAEEVIKSDKNLQKLWDDGTKAFNAVTKAFDKVKSPNDLKKLFSDDKNFLTPLKNFGNDLLKIKEEAMPSDPKNPGVLSKALTKLTDLKNQLQEKLGDLKDKIMKSEAGKMLKLDELEEQLTNAFKSGKLQENPLETIKNALVDTGTKIMKNALGDKIDPKVFTTLAENLSAGNKTEFFKGIQDLANKINEDSSGLINNYLNLNNLSEGAKTNINNLIKFYTDLKSTQPNLFAEVFNSADTPKEIKDMFTNILKGAGQKLTERVFNETIVKNFDVNKLVSDIKTLQQKGTNAAEQAKDTVKAQLQTLTEALYNAGEMEGSFQMGTYFNPEKHALTEAQQSALNDLKDLMADLKDNSEALFKDLFASTGGNDSPSYLGQYLWYFGTGNNANKKI